MQLRKKCPPFMCEGSLVMFAWSLIMTGEHCLVVAAQGRISYYFFVKRKTTKYSSISVVMCCSAIARICSTVDRTLKLWVLNASKRRKKTTTATTELYLFIRWNIRGSLLCQIVSQSRISIQNSAGHCAKAVVCRFALFYWIEWQRTADRRWACRA